MDKPKMTAEELLEQGLMPDIIDGETGEVIPMEKVLFAYTREGRRVIGKEYPNPVPIAPPIGFVPTKPLHEQIREMVMREMSELARGEEFETMEEADDFDVGDDFDPESPYEEIFDPQHSWPPSSERLRAAEEAAVRGGGGAEPPSGEPTSGAPGPAEEAAEPPPAKPKK